MEELEQKQKKGKSRKKLYLLGALSLALAITAGLFAYAYTTTDISLGMVVKSDIAEVEPLAYNATGEGYLYGMVFGKYRGDLPEGNLFSINSTADYTGDLTIKVSIMNPGQLAHAYQYFNMQLALGDKEGVIIIGTGLAPAGHEYQCLSLQNGVVEFDVSYSAGAGQPYYVRLVDGGFCSHGRSPIEWKTPWSVDPQLFCEVVARS